MPSGIILLDKPAGLSSNGALQRVRRAYGARSAGHVGTLDPMATGMLPICLDEATKVIAEIESGAKAYEFSLQLGARTDTGDAEGTVVETQPIPSIEDAAVAAVLARFMGPQSQVPPMYSAIKRDGRPLYELARRGVEVERKPRQIEIRRLEFAGREGTVLNLVCECSKGTYVRVLGEDIARALGTVGHLCRLRRRWVEPFMDLPMQTLEDVLEGASRRAGLLSADVAIQGLPRADLTAQQTAAIRHGQAVSAPSVPPAAPGVRVRLYGPGGAFLGLAEARSEGWLQPRRLITPEGA